MHVCQKNIGIFAIADPNFEINKRVQCLSVPYDRELVMGLIEKAMFFYEKVVFPKLINTFS